MAFPEFKTVYNIPGEKLLPHRPPCLFVDKLISADETGALGEYTYTDEKNDFFKGHFPGFPILPGVVQLGAAHRFAELFARAPLRIGTVKKLKFQRIIHPGEKVRFSLERRSDSEYAFRYEADGEVCSSGVMAVALSFGGSPFFHA